MSLVVARGVEHADVARLNEVSGDQQILLVRGQLDVVGSWSQLSAYKATRSVQSVLTDDGLILIRVIETDGVLEVRNVDSRDVVAKRQGEVSELSILGEIGVDSDRLLGLVAEVNEKLSDTLVALGVLAVRVDDPDFTSAHSPF